MAKTHNSGRKPAKPEYSAEKNLTNQMNAAVALYKSDMTLQAIAEELSLNPIKVRKLLITAGSIGQTSPMLCSRRSSLSAPHRTTGPLCLPPWLPCTYLAPQ